MIELLSEERCTNCDICVRVCPVNVFQARPGEAPIIARQSDCQSCFMCELYCPTDALYVAPDTEGHIEVREDALAEIGLLGSYRRAIGWAPETRAKRGTDQSFRLTQPH
jgi:NAD-dependent dihydropyrimidine dehydrogenase PreA subunit